MVLLRALLVVIPNDLDVVLLLDSRARAVDIPDHITIKFVNNSVFSRLGSELWLRSVVAVGDVVVCLGNIPPLFELKGKVSVLIQNRLIVDNDFDLLSLGGWTFARLLMERLMLTCLRKRNVRYFVQTDSMKYLVDSMLGCNASVFPFLGKQNITKSRLDSKKRFDFIYVASGENHKNHIRLLKAWHLLAESNVFPSLALTVNEKTMPPRLRYWIGRVARLPGARITNLGELTHQQVLDVYPKCGALIYPSLLESYGMPLVEAYMLGLPILASERDFVRDVVHPEGTFDPCSSLSISRAVRRFLGLEVGCREANDPSAFLAIIMREGP
jgi:glycosyltransferase involved in cell wall biosynthesis